MYFLCSWFACNNGKTNPKELKDNIRETVATFVASGIDVKKSATFNQSKVPAHSEAAWILSCVARMGWLNRMTQFKEKGKDKEKQVLDCILIQF